MSDDIEQAFCRLCADGVARQRGLAALADLRARLAECERERETSAFYIRKAQHLEGRAQALAAALERYGRHESRCHIVRGERDDTGLICRPCTNHCTCGLGAALAAFKHPSPVKTGGE